MYQMIEKKLKKLYRHIAAGAAGVMIFSVWSFPAVSFGEQTDTREDLEQMRQSVIEAKEVLQVAAASQSKVEEKEKQEEARAQSETVKGQEEKQQEDSSQAAKTVKLKEGDRQAIYPCAYQKITVEDYECLCRIIMAEAGNQGEKGMILVANVVLNRMKQFDMTIPEVVFQSGQFNPTWDGAYYSVVVSDEARQAARKALNGVDYSQGAMYFCTGAAVDSFFRTKLTFLFRYRDHLFYR